MMKKITGLFAWLGRSTRGHDFLFKGITTLILAAGSVVIMIPLAFMISTSLKDPAQIRSDANTLIPRKPVTVELNGERNPIYDVTMDGVSKNMAMIRKLPDGMAQFVDPSSPDEVLELSLKDQTALYRLDIHWENYPEALTAMPFFRYLGNTLIVTFVGMFGMLFSSSLVAYGFSRFRAKWLNTLFLILLSTIMLPSQVRLIPLYIFFQNLGWVNSLLPLIVPQFFANAYDVFLLRQFFMTIPLELDDAAKIDGANPLQVLLYIILPQARPALIAVGIFHFLYAWNDFYEPLIFLHSRENWTLAVGLQTFDALYTINTHLIMAVSVLMIVPPILLFFFSQKVFTQGVVFSGIKG
ncbi:MAG: carbohydrate ABC transporter permease [Chloroflexota bacterium]